MPSELGSEWITTSEAAELTGYGPVTFRWLVREGRIAGRKRGRDWFLDRSSVLEYVEEMRQLGPQKHDPTRQRSSEWITAETTGLDGPVLLSYTPIASDIS